MLAGGEEEEVGPAGREGWMFDQNWTRLAMDITYYAIFMVDCLKGIK